MDPSPFAPYRATENSRRRKTGGRMRARIDVSEVEATTKIRAKYLRALENEEWDLLPGPTFVTTFLRTYAEYLGLDATRVAELLANGTLAFPITGGSAPASPPIAWVERTQP